MSALPEGALSERLLASNRSIHILVNNAAVLPGERTGEWQNPVQYLLTRFHQLQKLYRDAEERGEAVLVRLGPQRRQQARSGDS